MRQRVGSAVLHRHAPLLEAATVVACGRARLRTPVATVCGGPLRVAAAVLRRFVFACPALHGVPSPGRQHPSPAAVHRSQEPPTFNCTSPVCVTPAAWFWHTSARARRCDCIGTPCSTLCNHIGTWGGSCLVSHHNPCKGLAHGAKFESKRQHRHQQHGVLQTAHLSTSNMGCNRNMPLLTQRWYPFYPGP